MNPNFTNFYNDLLALAQKHANNGTSLQEIYGALGAAQNHLGFMLHENYRVQSTAKECEETQKPMNEPAGEIPTVEVIEDN